jgi:hypothetical protein
MGKGVNITGDSRMIELREDMTFEVQVIFYFSGSKRLQCVAPVVSTHPGYRTKTSNAEGFLYLVTIDDRVGYSGRE